MWFVRSRSKGRRRVRCFEAWKPATYSASHVEAVTKRWRLDCHEMGPPRQKATKPEVERRVSLHEAKSEWAYAVMGAARSK